MSNEEQMVCDVCRKRPAIHHTCYGGTGLDRHLCMHCFEETASPEELEFHRQSTEALRHAKCKYCGAPAVGGSTGLSIPGVMDWQSEERLLASDIFSTSERRSYLDRNFCHRKFGYFIHEKLGPCLSLSHAPGSLSGVMVWRDRALSEADDQALIR